MKNRFKLVIAFLFILMVTVACSNNQSTTEQSSVNDETQTASENTENVELTISAAASLSDAMDVIGDTYEEEHPEVTLNFNFAGSGSLQQQISQGAPVDLFFSAAEDKFDVLVEEGKIAENDGVDLLGNSIVLVVPNEGQSMITGFEDLAKKDVEKISIGTPETVPAGKYGKESLENMGLWSDVESKVVYAKDVRQVLSYVETENVAAGMVYKTDASVSDEVTIVAESDPSTHTPIIYPVGIIKDTEKYEAAKEFYSFLQSDSALKVFEEYGFTVQ